MNTGINVMQPQPAPLDFMSLAGMINTNKEAVQKAVAELMRSNPRWQRLDEENRAFGIALETYLKQKMGR
jgi:hypothetical protein